MVNISAFSQKILVHRFYLLDKNPDKIIISGLSGSGKTTFARNLHKQFNLRIESLDDLYWNLAKEKVGPKFNPWSEALPKREQNEVMIELDEFIKKGKGTIFEGLHIGAPEIGSHIFDNPIFLLKTSSFTSTLRAIKRDLKKIENPFGFFGTVIDRIRTQIAIFDIMNLLECEILKRNEFEILAKADVFKLNGTRK